MQQEVWQLKVPVRLSLSQDEISSPGDVKPVYLLAPRFAYLPALAQQCISFFQHVLLSLPGQAAGSSAWFEYEGLALSWTQPLGVLHDLLAAAHGQQQQQQQQQQQCLPQPGPSSSAFSAAAALPWCLSVHYRNTPASLASTWQNSGTAKDHFFSSLKEAGYCCRGSDGCNAVMGLTGPAQDELWAAVNRGDDAAVQRLLGPLRLAPAQRQGSAVPTVPVRLYIRQHKPGSSSAGILPVWDEVFSTSRAVAQQQPDGSPTALAHLLHTVMPQRFPQPQRGGAAGAVAPTAQAPQGPACPEGQQQQQQQQAPDAPPAEAGDPLGALGGSPAAAAAAESGGGTPGASNEQGKAAASGSEQQQQQQQLALPPGWPDASACTVLVCGVSPDWCTPLAWLHANLRAADGFLYVVVHLLA